jgi:small subunit ribosomal protein S2
MVSVNMREMLEAGVHFGHQVRKWNPKMKPYIYGKKNGIYIINLQTSIELFKEALTFVTEVVASGKEALIVGTKKQAQSIITDISEETGMHYVNKRWLGGLLTNFSMIKKSIEKLIDLDEMKKDGRWEVKSKKEQSKLEKIYKKLHKNLWGMRKIKELPGVLIVIDSNFEEIAVYEAQKLSIPIVGIVDTNANPEGISYPVPGNDDAIRSIKLFTTKFGEAVKQGMEKRLANELSQKEEAEKEEEKEEEKETAEAVESEEGAASVEIAESVESEEADAAEEVTASVGEEEIPAPEESPAPVEEKTETATAEAAADDVVDDVGVDTDATVDGEEQSPEVEEAVSPEHEQNIEKSEKIEEKKEDLNKEN